ncbi:carbonic anhydrase [Deinococcus roseus]|uniref:carbonic anhydrase n=1 Tax=Deinococcus roseus TaxID=392414 RepID=UPI00166B01A6|nr:carbonic anhydrase [Deinococcus roseus]
MRGNPVIEHPEYNQEAEQAINILLSSHNEKSDGPGFEGPQLAIVTCMDYRINLRLPKNFAFVLRTGGANTLPIEPYLAFSVARTGIHAVAIIGHTDCAMQHPNPYVVEQLPASTDVKRDYRSQIASLAILDAPEYTRREAKRLAERLGLPVIPLLYHVEDHKITRL